VGVIIGAAILVIVWNTAKEMWRRMMDGIEPQVVEQIEHAARGVDGVMDVHDVAARWIGHRQRAELHITVNCQLQPSPAILLAKKCVMPCSMNSLPCPISRCILTRASVMRKFNIT